MPYLDKTNLSYLWGKITSAINTGLAGKSDTDHTHSYAGSSSVGGAATSANKLNTNAGSVTQPVYFANGVPVATTYTLSKSVPADAVFTDTTYAAITDVEIDAICGADIVAIEGVRF